MAERQIPVAIRPGSKRYRPVACRIPRTSIISKPMVGAKTGSSIRNPLARSLNSIAFELRRRSCMGASKTGQRSRFTVDRGQLLMSILIIVINISEAAVLMSAREAAHYLKVKPATLYAYVSRGLLRSAPGPDKRERRYYAD